MINMDRLERIRESIAEIEESRHGMHGEDLELAEKSLVALKEAERKEIQRLQKNLAAAMEDAAEPLRKLASEIRERVGKMTSAVKGAEKTKRILDRTASLLDGIADIL